MRPLAALLLALALATPASAQPAREKLAEVERLRARRDLRALDRDASRTLDATLEQQRGRVVPRAAQLRRARAEEDLDYLENRIDLDALGPLGPTTRRVLERSRIELLHADRLREVDARYGPHSGEAPPAQQAHPFRLGEEQPRATLLAEPEGSAGER